jgi:hypothetical protein
MGALFTHIVNPFASAAGSRNRKIQEISLQSIREASRFADPEQQPKLIAVSLPENDLPDLSGFQLLDPLTLSVQQEKGMESFPALPFIREILERGIAVDDSEYLIYTNMDIVLLPHFYRCVAQWVKEKPDAIIINRRRISDTFLDKPLEKIWAEVGKPHPGFDCFVLKKELIRAFILDDICIGIPFLEVSLMHNIFAFAKNYHLHTSLHLTTHIGEDVMPAVNQTLYRRNRKIYERKIYPQLKRKLRAKSFPHYHRQLVYRLWHYLLNPSYRFHQLTLLEGKEIRESLWTKWKDLRWKWLE